MKLFNLSRSTHLHEARAAATRFYTLTTKASLPLRYEVAGGTSLTVVPTQMRGTTWQRHLVRTVRLRDPVVFEESQRHKADTLSRGVLVFERRGWTITVPVASVEIL